MFEPSESDPLTSSFFLALSFLRELVLTFTGRSEHLFAVDLYWQVVQDLQKYGGIAMHTFRISIGAVQRLVRRLWNLE